MTDWLLTLAFIAAAILFVADGLGHLFPERPMWNRLAASWWFFAALGALHMAYEVGR